MQLRPYQADTLAAIRDAYRSGKRAPLLCSPTGSGKSAMTAYMLGRTTKRTLILCHREELRDMICASLPVPYNVIEGARTIGTERVAVGMMQTVSRRLGSLPKFEWVISDECHLSMAPTWRAILDHYKGAWHLGMSATPCRLDGQGLGTIFDTIVYGPTVRELINRSYLSPCRVFAPEHHVENLKKSGSDFNMEDAARLFDKASVTGAAAEHLRRLGPDRRAIVFCCTREHATHAAQQFRDAGFRAANVDGSMAPGERKQRFAGFRSGRIQVLTNVDLATTGFDDPGIAAEIMLRPTQSLALYLQMVGRALRIYPGKSDAILIDCVGNVMRHGMPDAEREWTLEGREKRSRAAAVRQCPKCYAAFLPAPKCPECGFLFPVSTRRTAPEQRDGSVVEITSGSFETRAQRLRSAPLKELIREAKTFEQLQEIGAARGFRHGWARRMHNFRIGKRTNAFLRANQHRAGAAA